MDATAELTLRPRALNILGAALCMSPQFCSKFLVNTAERVNLIEDYNDNYARPYQQVLIDLTTSERDFVEKLEASNLIEVITILANAITKEKSQLIRLKDSEAASIDLAQYLHKKYLLDPI